MAEIFNFSTIKKRVIEDWATKKFHKRQNDQKGIYSHRGEIDIVALFRDNCKEIENW